MADAEKKHIVLGITGGIAAYKSAMLCSMLVQHDYEVKVVMTENSQEFVTPLTFKTLSRNEVMTSLLRVFERFMQVIGKHWNFL